MLRPYYVRACAFAGRNVSVNERAGLNDHDVGTLLNSRVSAKEPIPGAKDGRLRAQNGCRCASEAYR